ncbi:(Fe-S)-binding protein [Pseudodesulfovibrio sp.]|uniref:(Fe-S)-binding protein n=1 Tax=Pseudodesulfovibrio sp. TaxID=2035812 RepID=UPI0026201FA5|nr:(Fe-S)-binding protein [Pseudodesulfovibrio sp.]MDD3313070.1 (Fe-S)-binding protein [Pseudodesulfovibrio sp.]
MADRQCILCGACMAVCPLLRATGREELSPRAKSDLNRLLAEGAADLSGDAVARLAGLCLGCHRCKAVCPQGVDVPEVVAQLRAAHPDFRRWLWKTWLTHAGTLWPAGSAAAKAVPEGLAPEKFGPSLRMLAGLSGGPGLTPLLEPVKFPDSCRGERMLLFAGCTATYVRKRWADTARRLLDGLGVEVLAADFGCCGSGLSAVGLSAEAGVLAERNLAAWRAAGRPRVAVFCASCLEGLRAYRPDDSAEAEAWRKALTPLSIVLHDIEFVVSPHATSAIGYHHPCHAPEPDPDLALLRRALGDRMVAATGKECCGFGGVMRLGAPELSATVNAGCWAALQGAELVLTGCSACATQLAATAPAGVTAGHWLELIA